jgi:holo-[acyl-carrier protein] synthase
MITGTGIDIVNISRITKGIEEHGQRFIEKILSPEEIAKIPAAGKEEYIAGRFAVKEALVKAAEMPLPFTGITVLNNEKGKPFVATVPSERINLSRVHISISHDRDYAVASVIIEE